MKPTAIIMILVFLAILAPPVAAVTYSEEYYKLGNISTMLVPHDGFVEYLSKLSVYVDVRHLYITTLELRRQTILMEKQNELLEEQINLTRMQTKMKLKCKAAGPISSPYCDEYSWVIGS